MISVCMATYNGARFIKHQIDSILCQLGSDDELVISDDGSTDGTLDIIESYGDSRIKLLNHSPDPFFSNHQKATSNYENALIQAKGDYIFLCDQDDIWLSNKVAVCIKHLKNNDFVVHGKSFINEKDEKINENDCLNLPKNWILHILNMKWFGCCMAFRRKVLDMALPFPQKLIGHDYWISTIALRFLSVKVILEPLILYRKHLGTVSQGKKNSFVFKVSYRLKLLFQLYQKIKHETRCVV